MTFANRLVSYNVIEWELQKCDEQPTGHNELGLPSLRKEALEMRREMLQLHVETGQLSMEQYLQQLREAIPKEKARSASLKAMPGGVRRALEAFKHAQMMQKELDEAVAATAAEDDE